HWFHVHTGGDLAFLVGVLRVLIESNAIDESFIRSRTVGFEAARDSALAADWPSLERESGASRAQIEAFAQLRIERPKAVLIWSMGLTQNAGGVQTVKALINIGLARGLPGRANCGLVPIRGHSGVQGGSEVGCTPALDAETAARYAKVWGFDLP